MNIKMLKCQPSKTLAPQLAHHVSPTQQEIVRLLLFMLVDPSEPAAHANGFSAPSVAAPASDSSNQVSVLLVYVGCPINSRTDFG